MIPFPWETHFSNKIYNRNLHAADCNTTSHRWVTHLLVWFGVWRDVSGLDHRFDIQYQLSLQSLEYWGATNSRSTQRGRRLRLKDTRILQTTSTFNLPIRFTEKKALSPGELQQHVYVLSRSIFVSWNILSEWMWRRTKFVECSWKYVLTFQLLALSRTTYKERSLENMEKERNAISSRSSSFSIFFPSPRPVSRPSQSQTKLPRKVEPSLWNVPSNIIPACDSTISSLSLWV